MHSSQPFKHSNRSFETRYVIRVPNISLANNKINSFKKLKQGLKRLVQLLKSTHIMSWYKRSNFNKSRNSSTVV